MTEAVEITYITAVANAVAQDDRRTRATLSLLRNGHPGSNPPRDDAAPIYGDPTGEWAINPDSAAHLQDQYADAIAHVAAWLELADSIRQKMAPIAVRPNDAKDPDDWCKNCLDHAQLCIPRTKDGGLYCKWCTVTRRVLYGDLPPAHIVKLHHRGDKNGVARAITEHLRRRKKK